MARPSQTERNWMRNNGRSPTVDEFNALKEMREPVAPAAPAKKVARGIRADIYRSDFGDFSGGGISGRVKEVTIIDDRIDGPFEPSDDAPAVRIVERVIMGKPYVHVEPIDQPDGMLGPMMGGTYVATPDSRLRAIATGAIPLHDRFETAAQYASLST
jgi:hypothetical protein